MTSPIPHNPPVPERKHYFILICKVLLFEEVFFSVDNAPGEYSVRLQWQFFQKVVDARASWSTRMQRRFCGRTPSGPCRRRNELAVFRYAGPRDRLRLALFSRSRRQLAAELPLEVFLGDLRLFFTLQSRKVL